MTTVYLPAVSVETPSNTEQTLLSIKPEGIQVKISHYWPALGGVNCANFINGECISKTASGQPWRDWIGKGAACARQYAYGTKFKLPDGSIWVCVDRGSAIVVGNVGIAWVDLLQEYASYPFGEVVDAEIIK